MLEFRPRLSISLVPRRPAKTDYLGAFFPKEPKALKALNPKPPKPQTLNFLNFRSDCNIPFESCLYIYIYNFSTYTRDITLIVQAPGNTGARTIVARTLPLNPETLSPNP